MKKFILIFIILIGYSVFAQSNYYVNNFLGEDITTNGTGTGRDAWKTIDYAVNHVTNPTTDSIVIYVANGEYSLSNIQINFNRDFKNLTISGENNKNTIVEANSDPTLSTARIFKIFPGNKVQFFNLTLRYGHSDRNGGAIFNDSGKVYIQHCIITQNFGGTIGVGGGVSNLNGYCNIDNSVISNNITQDSCYGGGIGSINGVVEISNSTISYNSSLGGGGIAIISYRGNIVFNMTNSTVSKNNASYFYGGIRIDRWAVNDYSIKANINSSTIFDNNSEGVNGMGGIGVLNSDQPNQTVIIKNSIIAGNTAIERPDVSGNIISGDYNLIENTSGAKITGITTHNIYGLSPKCSALANNNSLNGTQTCAISFNSPARDVIPPDSANGAPIQDQRGALRKGYYDIGSYEYWNDSSTFAITNIEKPNLPGPSSFELYQNYPNPFNPSTIIKYNISQPGQIKLTVFNLLGQEIAVLVQEYENAGTHTAEFNSFGLSSGIYFYKLESGNNTKIMKMVLMK